MLAQSPPYTNAILYDEKGGRENAAWYEDKSYIVLEWEAAGWTSSSLSTAWHTAHTAEWAAATAGAEVEASAAASSATHTTHATAAAHAAEHLHHYEVY